MNHRCVAIRSSFDFIVVHFSLVIKSVTLDADLISTYLIQQLQIFTMNRKYIYISLVVLFLGATAFVISRYTKSKREKESIQYTLQPRMGALAKSEEWTSTKQIAYRLNTTLQAKPNDTKTTLELVTLFIQ